MCYTSAKGLAIQTTYTNNLPTQTNDVMVNPENPDSNPAAARIISTEEWGVACFKGMFPVTNFESGFTGLQRTSSV